jgi:hypothetical protein
MDNPATQQPLDPEPPAPPGGSAPAPDLPDVSAEREVPDDNDVSPPAGLPEPPD